MLLLFSFFTGGLAELAWRNDFFFLAAHLDDNELLLRLITILA
jgi:hypothetical protein